MCRPKFRDSLIWFYDIGLSVQSYLDNPYFLIHRPIPQSPNRLSNRVRYTICLIKFVLAKYLKPSLQCIHFLNKR